MRVIAGSAKGRRLKTVPSRKVRPTSDRVKEALFSSLESRIEVRGADVLDLFAGSGALGIEALSRGAGSAVFVERDRRAGVLLRQNVEACGFADRSRIMARSVSVAIEELAERGPRFRVVLIDPPYAERVAGRVLSAIDRAGIAAPGGVVAVEHGSDEALADVGGLRLTQTRRYGNTCVTLLSRRSSDDTPQ